MRGAVRNKERWKRRRTPTQDPSTDLVTFSQAKKQWSVQCAAPWKTVCVPAAKPNVTSVGMSTQSDGRVMVRVQGTGFGGE